MSFSFVVAAEGGTLKVDNVTGDVPEGKYQVSGHEDEANRSLGVTRFSQTGLVVSQATTSGRRDI